MTAVLMPVVLLPIGLAVPSIVRSQRAWEREQQSAPHPAPTIRLTAAQELRFEPVTAYRNRVPVLLYHGINASRDGKSVSRRAFAEQMAALHRMGFHTIGIGDFLRFRRGDARGLPSRPILITFDGGRLDSYRGADRVLARYGLGATMFVPTAEPERESHDHLMWRELQAMQESGRWDIQSQGHNGDRLVASNRQGVTRPFYAARRYTMSDGLESLAEFEQRVAEDLFASRQALEDHGFGPRAIAVPYGDVRIPRVTEQLMTRQFQTVLFQDASNAPAYTRPRGKAERYEVHSGSTTDQLYMWLRDESPAWIATHPERPSKPLRRNLRRWLRQTTSLFGRGATPKRQEGP